VNLYYMNDYQKIIHCFVRIYRIIFYLQMILRINFSLIVSKINEQTNIYIYIYIYKTGYVIIAEHRYNQVSHMKICDSSKMK
jgi:hypothetical protein